MGAGPVASTILAGAALQGDLTQAAGQLLLRPGAVNGRPLAFVGPTTDGLYHNGTNPGATQGGVGRLGMGAPINAITALLAGGGLRLDGETAKTGNYTVLATDT